MSKIYYIIVMIHQFVSPKRRSMGEAKEVLTFNLFWIMILFSIVYESCRSSSSQSTTKCFIVYLNTNYIPIYVIDLIVDLINTKDVNSVTDPSRIGIGGRCSIIIRMNYNDFRIDLFEYILCLYQCILI